MLLAPALAAAAFCKMVRLHACNATSIASTRGGSSVPTGTSCDGSSLGWLEVDTLGLESNDDGLLTSRQRGAGAAHVDANVKHATTPSSMLGGTGYAGDSASPTSMQHGMVGGSAELDQDHGQPQSPAPAAVATAAAGAATAPGVGALHAEAAVRRSSSQGSSSFETDFANSGDHSAGGSTWSSANDLSSMHSMGSWASLNASTDSADSPVGSAGVPTATLALPTWMQAARTASGDEQQQDWVMLQQQHRRRQLRQDIASGDAVHAAAAPSLAVLPPQQGPPAPDSQADAVSAVGIPLESPVAALEATEMPPLLRAASLRELRHEQSSKAG